jgi:hypothetical protein
MSGRILYRPERVELDRPGMSNKGHLGLGSTISAGTRHRPPERVRRILHGNRDALFAAVELKRHPHNEVWQSTAL